MRIALDLSLFPKAQMQVSNLQNSELCIKSRYRPKIGDSIAINGVCLTVIKLFDDGFSVELSEETQKIIALENYENKVHIEPAMRLDDRLEGHIVQGHVDTIGTVEKIVKSPHSRDYYIKIDLEYIKYIIPKGSITIDGVSLTVNDVFQDSFRLTIINHTFENTLFKEYQIGSRVNIETDMFARYIYHLFKQNDKVLNWDSVDKVMAIY